MSAPATAAPEPRRLPAGRGFSWLGEAFEQFRRQPGTWIGISLIYLLIQFAAASMRGASLLSMLFGPVFSGGLMLACRSQETGEGPKVEQLFAGFRGGQLGQLLLLSVIYIGGGICAVLVGALLAIVGFGLSPANLSDSGVPDDYVLPLLLVLLVVLALIIPLMMGMWLSPALIVLRGLAPVAAFKLSFRACLVNFVPLLLYGLLGLLIAIVATIPLGLGWLVAMPVFTISVFSGYRDIFPPQPPDFSATQPIQPPA